jgi:MFS family permease
MASDIKSRELRLAEWNAGISGGGYSGLDEVKKAFWGPLRQSGFARLFSATLIAEIGARIHRIALLVLVYTITTDALWVSLIVAIQVAASVGVGIMVSPWSEAQDRKRMLAASDLLRACLMPLIPLLGVRSLGVLLALVFAIEVLRNVYDPIRNAVVPDLVTEEELDSANGLLLFAQRFAEVAFVGLAGILVAAVGPQPAFWINAFFYLVSGTILLSLPRLTRGKPMYPDYRSRAQEGIMHMIGSRVIRRVVGTLFVAAMFGSVGSVLGVVLAIKVLQVGSAGFGFLEAAMALGAIVGTLLVPRLTTRIPRERLFLAGLFTFGLFLASIGVFPTMGWVLVAYLITGALNMTFLIPVRSILQLNTPTELRIRTFAAFSAILSSAMLIGALLSGILEGYLGSPLIFLLAGLTISAVALSVVLRGGIPAPDRRWPEATA